MSGGDENETITMEVIYRKRIAKNYLGNNDLRLDTDRPETQFVYVEMLLLRAITIKRNRCYEDRIRLSKTQLLPLKVTMRDKLTTVRG